MALFGGMRGTQSLTPAETEIRAAREARDLALQFQQMAAQPLPAPWHGTWNEVNEVTTTTTITFGQRWVQEINYYVNPSPYPDATSLESAKELLLAHLSPKDRKNMLRYEFLEAIGSGSKDVYRINTTKAAGNIFNRRINVGYCILIKNPSPPCYPTAFHILAQKLLIEHDEPTFLRIAIPSHYERCPRWAAPDVD